MILELTQPLIEMSTRDLPVGKGRPARKRRLPLGHLWADCLENVGDSPMDFRGLLQG
jgi:hypothetical protein